MHSIDLLKHDIYHDSVLFGPDLLGLLGFFSLADDLFWFFRRFRFPVLVLETLRKLSRQFFDCKSEFSNGCLPRTI